MDFELYERLMPQLKSKSAREFYFTWACDIIALEPEDREGDMNWDFMLDALQERIAKQGIYL